MNTLLFLTLLSFHGKYQELQVKFWESRLGDTSFRERQKASNCLSKCNLEILPIVYKLEKSKDPEVVHRAKMQKERLRELYLESLEPFPQIDVLWWKGDGYHYYSLEYGKYSPYLDIPHLYNPLTYKYTNEKFRGATRVLLGEYFDKGVPLWEIRLIWLRMHLIDHRGPRQGCWQDKWNEVEFLLEKLRVKH